MYFCSDFFFVQVFFTNCIAFGNVKKCTSNPICGWLTNTLTFLGADSSSTPFKLIQANFTGCWNSTLINNWWSASLWQNASVPKFVNLQNQNFGQRKILKTTEFRWKFLNSRISKRFNFWRFWSFSYISWHFCSSDFLQPAWSALSIGCCASWFKHALLVTSVPRSSYDLPAIVANAIRCALLFLSKWRPLRRPTFLY